MISVLLAALIQISGNGTPQTYDSTVCHPREIVQLDRGRSFSVFEDRIAKGDVIIGISSYGVPYTKKDGSPFHYLAIRIDDGIEMMLSAAKLFGEVHDSTPLYVRLAHLNLGQHKIEVSLLDYARSPILTNILCESIK